MNREQTRVREEASITPICPWCETQLDEIYKRSNGLGFFVGRNVVYFCPDCHKVLGVGQSRLA